ncbi:hypothetical protein NBRC10512v2_006750 [Rhodotorula toruloides]|uniref:RHTO0S01e05424g1_1 n=2 Tax=Rhodotorula toruloides TaxID=5286 RepID=A0A061AEZ0_RHOTO|nr:uncharacterized protein RHTO_01446 [Rhodotorula toruloides NP11]EMS21799.1 hypothetical protein RHTO_01446 [Rhodotorula toruloides NP11]CDR35711.1 RHTO0S01e05424g1_1 [Rhodotorula toruloides]
MSTNDTSTWYDGDVPTMSAPQSLADVVLGPLQVGYQDALPLVLILFGVYLSLFILYAALGELKKHSRVGQAALTASCVLNAVFSGFVFYESYLTAVSQNRSSFVLENNDLTWNVLPMLIGIITAITEGFLSARAGQLIASRLVRILFWVAVTCADGVLYHDGAEAADLVIQYTTGNSIYFWASCVADISISIACAWSLRARIAGFNPSTDSLLRHLISIAFRTAAYTAVFSLASAILATVYGDDTLNAWIVYCFWMFMPAAYGLSLFTFATSSKRAIEQRLGSSGSQGNVGGTAAKRRTTFKTSAVPGETPIPLETIRLPRTQPLEIHVQHEQVVSVDHNDDTESKGGSSEKHHGPEWEV